MTILSYIITIIVVPYCCIVLYSIKWVWPPCKVVFRVGNQNTKYDKHFVCCYIEYRDVPSIISSTHSKRAPDAGAWGAPVLRGECEEAFVFELSGTINTVLHTINTTYQVATTQGPPSSVESAKRFILCFD